MGFFRCRKKLQAKEKQLPAEKPNTSYNLYVRGLLGLEGRQKLSVHYDRRPPQRQAARQVRRGELTIAGKGVLRVTWYRA